jgi:hypothetical protein
MSYPPISPSHQSLAPPSQQLNGMPTVRGTSPSPFPQSSESSVMHGLNVCAFDLFAFISELLWATQTKQTRGGAFFVLYVLSQEKQSLETF